MVKKFVYKKTKQEVCLIQIKVTPEERNRLKQLCLILDISVQEFLRRMLSGYLDKHPIVIPERIKTS